MASAKYSQLLIDAPEGRHFCQLHKSPQALAQAVATFTDAGFERGDAVVIVASAARVELIRQKLGPAKVAARMESRQLFVHDSTEMLNKFMRGQAPERAEFRETVRGVLGAAKASGRKSTRVYGEMVNDLWRAGNTAAAIRVEEYWNELAREYQFCLFCGYELAHEDETSYQGPVEEIARVHTDMLSTVDDEKFEAAVDAASKEILGSELSEKMRIAAHSGANADERRLPLGRQMILWLKQYRPEVVAQVLERARRIYGG